MSLRERWRALDPRRGDLLLALGLSALLIVLMALTDDREGPLAANLALGLVITLSLIVRRDRPLLTASIASAGALAMQALLSSPGMIPALAFSLIVASYSAGAHATGRRSAAGLVLVSGAILIASIIETPQDILFPFLVFGVAPWVVGRALRSHTELARELAEQEARLRHLREQEEAVAVTRERTRVARELHDVLAHNLSVMVIQASGARRALARDPQRAAEAAGQIERTAREAMIELRQIFGPLRHGEGESLEGTVGLAQVPQLVARAREAGLDVDLELDGEPVALAPGADAAAYRLVQEALTNALKHAGGASTRVRVGYRPGGVAIAVTDDGAGAGKVAPLEGAGQGLVGMRERIELYDGEFAAGPRAGGGYEVHARLPVQPAGVAAG